MPLDDRLLVSEAALRATAQSSLPASTAETVIVEAIEDAQGAVEVYLDRTLFVDLYVQSVLPDAWAYHPDRENELFIYAEHWPVVTVTTPATGYSADPTGRLLLTEEVDDDAVPAFWAGFRRADQTFTQLNTITGTSVFSAQVLPEVVPKPIRRAISRLALLYLAEARAGLMGGMTKTTVVGGATVSSERLDRDAELRILQPLAPLRRVTA